MTTNFKLPDLIAYAPWEFALNPNMESVGAESLKWRQSCGILTTEHLAKRLEDSRPEYFAAFSFPYVDARRLRTFCDFSTLGLAMDDRVDEGDLQEDDVGASSFFNTILGALKKPENAPEDPIPRLFAECVSRFFRLLSRPSDS